MTFFGVQAGRIITYYQRPRERLFRWLSWALALGSIALLVRAAGRLPAVGRVRSR